MQCKVDIEKRANMNFEFFEVDAMGISSYRDEHELKARGVVIGPEATLPSPTSHYYNYNYNIYYCYSLDKKVHTSSGQGLWCLLLIIG